MPPIVKSKTPLKGYPIGDAKVMWMGDQRLDMLEVRLSWPGVGMSPSLFRCVLEVRLNPGASLPSLLRCRLPLRLNIRRGHMLRPSILGDGAETSIIP